MDIICTYSESPDRLSGAIGHVVRFLVGLVVATCLLAGCQTASEESGSPKSDEYSSLESLGESGDEDVPYVPTPQNVVEQMLEMADVTEADTVYDLGSGDGRIVITAARKYGAHGVGIDINPQRVAEARENAEKAGVSDLVSFQQGDLFEMEIRNATVVTLYLLPDLNEKLLPKLLRELEPGTPVVSHSFGIGDWQPEKKANVDGSILLRWTIPEKIPPGLLE